jgi:hypothetical protein
MGSPFYCWVAPPACSNGSWHPRMRSLVTKRCIHPVRQWPLGPSPNLNAAVSLSGLTPLRLLTTMRRLVQKLRNTSKQHTERTASSDMASPAPEDDRQCTADISPFPPFWLPPWLLLGVHCVISSYSSNKTALKAWAVLSTPAAVLHLIEDAGQPAHPSLHRSCPCSRFFSELGATGISLSRSSGLGGKGWL